MENITENIIVELRQQNRYATAGGPDQEKNGDYNVEINKPIDIVEGDVVEISSVFVDDNATSLGLINIEEDVSGSIECYQYFYDVQPSTFKSSSATTATDIRSYLPAGTATKHPDGHHYFLSQVIQSQPANGGQAGAHTFLCSALDIKYDFYKATPPYDFIQIYFKWEYPLGTRKTCGLQLDQQKVNAITRDGLVKIDQSNLANLLYKKKGPGKANPSKFSFPFLFQSPKTGLPGADNYQSESPVFDAVNGALIQADFDDDKHAFPMEAAGVSIVSLPPYTQALPTAGWELVTEPRALSLAIRTATFNIPSGKYDPDVLAQTINQQIVGVGDPADNNSIVGTAYDSNNILTTTDRIYAEGSGITANTPPYFVREDGEAVSQYVQDQTDPINTYWVGASNFGVAYSGAGRFEFSNLHQTRYSTGAGGNSKVVTVEEEPNQGGGNPKKFHLANKSGGIVFKDLKPHTFWFGQGSAMGFSQDILCKPKTAKLPFNLSDPVPHGSPAGATFSCQAEFFDAGSIQEGINTTCDLNSLNVLINKVGYESSEPADGAAYYDKPGSSVSGTENAIIQTIGIFGFDVMEGAAQANAYYKVEIDMPGIRSDVRGANQQSGKIQGIIGRFYQGATFTQAVGGEGSIPYIHKGPPIKLSHFGVRILMPDGVTVAPLAADNTVFLSITKRK